MTMLFIYLFLLCSSFVTLCPLPNLSTRDAGVFLSSKGWGSSSTEAAIPQNRWGVDSSLLNLIEDTRHLQAKLLLMQGIYDSGNL